MRQIADRLLPASPTSLSKRCNHRPIADAPVDFNSSNFTADREAPTASGSVCPADSLMFLSMDRASAATLGHAEQSWESVLRAQTIYCNAARVSFGGVAAYRSPLKTGEMSLFHTHGLPQIIRSDPATNR